MVATVLATIASWWLAISFNLLPKGVKVEMQLFRLQHPYLQCVGLTFVTTALVMIPLVWHW